MKCPSADEVANILDTAKCAIDKSSFGPMYMYPGNTTDISKKQVNQLAFALLPQVIKSIFDRAQFDYEKKE